MAAFCWMLVEGIYLYLFVVKVYNINTKMHMYHVMSWGIYNYLLPYLVYYSPTYTSFFVFSICRSSVVMVAISLSIAAGKEGMKSFTNDK